MIKRIQNIIISLLMIALLTILIIYSKDTAETIKHCIGICADTLIPSIFAYMILCTFLINSGLSDIIVSPLWHISKHFIKIDRKLFSAFILSLIAGYPVGIKMLTELISQNKNYSETAYKIAPFCFASGPAFIIGIAGNVIYNSSKAGLIIFISCTISNIIGVIVFSTKKNNYTPHHLETPDISGKTVSYAFMSSIKAILMVCMSMIVFNIAIMLISCICDNSIKNSNIFYYIKSFIEVTNICTLNISTPLWLVTFFISFGGLCVIFQIFLISDGRLKIIRFTISRFFVSIVSSLICFVITELSGFEPTLPVFYRKSPYIMLDNPLVMFCLGVMTLILMTFLSKQMKY